MTSALIILMMRVRWFGVAAGTLFFLGFAWLTWTSWREVQAYSRVPEAMPATRLPLRLPRPGLYVALSGVSWDCTRSVRDPANNATIVPGTIGGRRVFASLGDSPVPCSQATRTNVTGVVNDIWPAFAKRLRDAEVDVESEGGATTLELCTRCTPSNSKTGVFVSAGLALLAIFAALGCAWAPWRPRVVPLESLEE